MSQMMFYKNTVTLNREQHRKLRFTAVTDYRFCQPYNSVPVACVEFFDISRNMPVLFTRLQDGNYFPMALLSLQNAGHSMVDERGNWFGSTFIPSFIRRYPFALTPEGSVCFDSESGAFSDTEGDRLFTDDGKNTDVLDNVMAFLNQYDIEMRRTHDFCRELARCNLFREINVEVGNSNEARVRVSGLYAVDEQKFSELKPKTLEDWFRKGWIGWVYAHLHSISSLGMLPRDNAVSGTANQQAGAEAAEAAGSAAKGSGAPASVATESDKPARKAPAKAAKKVESADGELKKKAAAKKPAEKKAPAKKAPVKKAPAKKAAAKKSS